MEQRGVQSAFTSVLSVSSVSKGLIRFMCTVRSESPIVNVTVEGPLVSFTNQGPVQRGCSLPAQGLLNKTCWPGFRGVRMLPL